MHILVGSVPELFKFKIRGYTYNHAGPLGNDLLSRDYVTIEFDKRNLGLKQLKEAYRQAGNLLNMAYKKPRESKEKELYLFVAQNYDGIRQKTKTKKECWEHLYKIWRKDHPEPKKENNLSEEKKADNLRRSYDRVKQKIETGYL